MNLIWDISETEHTRSESTGFFIIFSSHSPWAVPISMTPLSAIDRQAWASASVPISSTMITSGMWFSTASIMTLCCNDGSGTCILRAFPIAECGISPSPPISLLVSTITWGKFYLVQAFLKTQPMILNKWLEMREIMIEYRKSLLTTLFWNSSDKTRAISRITVVFPTPGLK